MAKPSSGADTDAQALRLRAESQASSVAPGAALSEAQARRLVHELQVHQIELELQNEALRQSQLETKGALERVSRLKDELLVSRDLAVAASRAKSAFLAHMSHELRTPLNGAMGMTHLALLRATDPKQIDWLQKSLLSANHLLAIINDILDISKIEAGKLILTHKPFTLADLLKDLSSIEAAKAAGKGLSLDLEVPPELAGRTLWGDSMRLMQVLLNLTSNALKFTDVGGVRVRVDVILESLAELELRFEVADTGMGIAEADQLRLFQAFEQIDDSITRRTGGTGLGLAISMRLSQLMGGRIGVVSAPGQGSKFWFTAQVGSHEPGQCGQMPLSVHTDVNAF
jgi:signal transduction histidine kinase